MDTQEGEITKAQAGANVTNVDSDIENYGNGWFRVWARQTSSQTALLPIIGISDVAEPTIGGFGQITIASNDGRSAYVYGAQCEAGSYATSYIGPTLSSAVTRVVENAVKNGVSSLIGQTAGTLFIDVDLNGTISADQQWLEVNDGTTSNRMYIGLYSIYSLFRVVYGGTEVVNINNTLSVGNRYKMAMTYENNSVKAFINGAKIGQDLSASIPATSTIRLNYNDNAQIAINTALLFPSVLTEAQAIELTTL